MSVFVANESGVALDNEQLTGLLRFALDRLGVHPLAEVSLLAVDLQSMSDLHEQWMDETGPTDVMSFPMDELTERGSWEAEPSSPGPALLGDIVVCPEFARRQAEERGHPFLHELAILTVHGLLHLLGYDHDAPAEEAAMFARQEELVLAWEARGPASTADPGAPADDQPDDQPREQQDDQPGDPSSGPSAADGGA